MTGGFDWATSELPPVSEDLSILALGYSPSGSGEARASTAHVATRAAKTRAIRLANQRMMKAESYAAQLAPLEPIGVGETIHLLSRGQFDTVTILAHHAGEHGGIKRLSCSSLSISANSVQILKQLEDTGLLDQCRIMVQDLTMKLSEHREHIEAIRGWMLADSHHILRCAETHAKVYVIEYRDEDAVSLVVESSANLTSNDNRLEQYTVTRSDELARFHLDWMGEIFNYPEGRLPRNAFPDDPRLQP